jgi:hypothetical protein
MKYVMLLIVLFVLVAILFHASSPSSPETSSSTADSRSEGRESANEERGSPRQADLRAEELKRLKDGRQYDLDLIDAVHATLAASSPDDAITEYCSFTVNLPSEKLIRVFELGKVLEPTVLHAESGPTGYRCFCSTIFAAALFQSSNRNCSDSESRGKSIA